MIGPEIILISVFGVLAVVGVTALFTVTSKLRL